MTFITNFLHKFKINKYSAFIWNSHNKNLGPIKNLNRIDLNLIVGVETQKKHC